MLLLRRSIALQEGDRHFPRWHFTENNVVNAPSWIRIIAEHLAAVWVAGMQPTSKPQTAAAPLRCDLTNDAGRPESCSPGRNLTRFWPRLSAGDGPVFTAARAVELSYNAG